MKGEIKAAIERFEERKTAAGLGEQPVIRDQEVVRRSWSGLDLDLGEVEELLPYLMRAALIGILTTGLPPAKIAADLWCDGLAVGLLVAEARAKAEATA